MMRKLIIGCLCLMVGSSGLAAYPPAAKTANEGIDTILKLSRNDALKMGAVLGLGSLGFFFATKYCWQKATNWFTRPHVEYHPNGQVRLLGTAMHVRDIPMAVYWGSLTGLYGFGTAVCGLPALACLMHALHLTLETVRR